MRWLVTGATGKLGDYVLRALAATAHEVVGWSRTLRSEFIRQVALSDSHSVETAFLDANPDVVLHLGAVSGIAPAEKDPDFAHRINATATDQLAKLAANAHRRLVYVSSDMVFDGENAPYRECDAPDAGTVYGKSKAEGEEQVRKHSSHAVVRIALLFGPCLSPKNASFFDQQVESFRNGNEVTLLEDEWRTPLYMGDAANALVRVAQSDFTGVLHMGGPERLSRLDMGRRIAAAYGLSSESIRVMRRSEIKSTIARSRDLTFDSSLWRNHFPETPWHRIEEAL